jgi:hypothetical protein
MVMVSEHMVDGDGVDDDGSEDDVKIPLSGMESRTSRTLETNIMVVTVLCFVKSSILLSG